MREITQSHMEFEINLGSFVDEYHVVLNLNLVTFFLLVIIIFLIIKNRQKFWKILLISVIGIIFILFSSLGLDWSSKIQWNFLPTNTFLGYFLRTLS